MVLLASLIAWLWAIVTLIFRVEWSKLPIKFDRPAPCEHCRAITTHNFTVYQDAEYHRCTRCGLRTTWEPGGQKKLELTDADLPDPRIEEDRFKRENPRHYRPRWKKGGGKKK